MKLVNAVRHSLARRAWWLTLASSLLIFIPAAEAQDFHRLDLHFAGGFTSPTGDLGTHLNTGWNMNGGAGFNFTHWLGINANVLYTSFGINRTTLTALEQPDGTSHTWAFTLDPIIRFPISSHFIPYVTGGGGYFRSTIEFTKPTIALVPFYDPWFGILGQVAIPANEVLGRFSKSSGGYDIGAGVQIPLGRDGLSFYSEARYYYAPTEPTSTTFLPVSFGIRW
jgi:opacity protein-like surface antigen